MRSILILCILTFSISSIAFPTSIQAHKQSISALKQIKQQELDYALSIVKTLVLNTIEAGQYIATTYILDIEEYEVVANYFSKKGYLIVRDETGLVTISW